MFFAAPRWLLCAPRQRSRRGFLMKTPAEFRFLMCVCERTLDAMLLTYSRARGFFDPITNLDAVPVVGKIVGWRYEMENCL